MIMDNEVILADDLAHDGTAEVVNLETTYPGPGNPIKVWVQGSSTLAEATGFTISDGTTSSPSDTLISHTCTLAGKTVEVELPSDVAQYITIALNGTTSDGTYSAAISMPGVQTNK